MLGHTMSSVEDLLSNLEKDKLSNSLKFDKHTIVALSQDNLCSVVSK